MRACLLTHSRSAHQHLSALMHNFGSPVGDQCRSLKERLLEMKVPGTGRVVISDFYSNSKLRLLETWPTALEVLMQRRPGIQESDVRPHLGNFVAIEVWYLEAGCLRAWSSRAVDVQLAVRAFSRRARPMMPIAGGSRPRMPSVGGSVGMGAQ